jgi:transposase
LKGESPVLNVALECCAGIDVGKKVVAVCVLTSNGRQAPDSVTKMFGTTVTDLSVLKEWLQECGCTQVVMESTGCYWKPVFNILEESMGVLLANAQHIKNVPGRKTDVKDCQWLAYLLRHGLIRGSFIPPRPIRELRDLTRRRKQLIAEGTAERNRIQKVLEDSNLKLGDVLSDLFGRSGQEMLEALLEGQATSAEIAELARRRLRSKIPAIIKSIEGHSLRDHHRFQLKQGLAHLQFLEKQVDEIDEEIQRRLLDYREAYELLKAIPGLGKDSAAAILAEIGVEMSQFPSAAHLCSWAGVCPGNNESAGRHRSGHTRKGNSWLRSVLTQSAWAATRTKKAYFRSRYERIVSRRGKKRALVAAAHSLLTVIYYVLSRRTPYHELGVDYFDRKQKDAQIRYHEKRL